MIGSAHSVCKGDTEILFLLDIIRTERGHRLVPSLTAKIERGYDFHCTRILKEPRELELI